jgi:antitoxin MazE
MKAHLKKWGNSLAIRIPKPIVAAAKLKPGDGLELKVDGPGTIQMRAENAKPILSQLVRQITSENRHVETDWGKPTGNELW